MSILKATPAGVTCAVRVVPRARADELAGTHGDALKVRLRSPPVDGRANAALVRFLADILDIPPSRVQLLAGETARTKRLLFHGVTEPHARARLGL